MPPKGKKKSKPGSGGAKAKKKKAAALANNHMKKSVKDLTFGMKNKKKSKKVAAYAENLANAMRSKAAGGREDKNVAGTIAGRKAQEAQRKRAKLAREKKEREMMKVLGPGYSLKNVASKKLKKMQEAEKRKAELEIKQMQEAQDKIDFAIPIVGLDKVMMCEGKSEVPRLLCVIQHRDAQTGAMKDGTPLLNIKIVDGSTKYPVLMVVQGELAKSFGDEGFKVNKVIDVRNCVAMMRAVRGEPRRICVEMLEKTTLTVASERLTKHVKALIVERDEIRARGGIPIEEMIEEERMALPSGGTPVTKETFHAWLKMRKVRRDKERKQKNADASKRKKGGVLTGAQLFAKNKNIFVDDEAGAGKEAYANRVTLSDAEDSDDDDADTIVAGPGPEQKSGGGAGGGGKKTKKKKGGDAAAPAAPSAASAQASVLLQGKKVEVGDASLYLDGDDDDLDDLDLDD